MRENDGRLCRLCLCVLSNENFDEKGKNIKGMIEVIQLKLNCHIGEEHIVCSNCMENIKECSNFKSTYLNTEDFIVTLHNSENKAKLDLREVYIQKNRHMTTADIGEDRQICRFCIKLSESSTCKPLIEIGEHMIQKSIPKFNFNLTKDPVICDSCLNSLKLYFQFMQTCADTEEKINKYLKSESTGSQDPVDLNKVVQFAKNISEYGRDVTKLNVGSLDELCRENNENNIIKIEVIVKKEDAECYRENVENDIKIDVEEIVMKREIKEESLESQNGEWEMMFEQNELQTCADTDDINVNENIMKMEIKGEFLELQNGKLEIINEENELQIEQSNFESFRDTSSQMTINNINTEGYKCESCSHIAKRKSRLKHHMLTHRELSEVTTYDCDQCSFKSKYKTSLREHKLTHQELSEVRTVHKCKSCSFVTKHKGSLRTHTLIHHSSNRTEYKCQSCSYVAKLKGCLKKHMLTHQELSEVKVYNCHICSYVTKRKDNLKSHLLTHREHSKVTENMCEQMFKCDSCSYETKHKSVLKMHVLNHREPSEITVYNCEICSFVTKYKYYLNKHKRLVHQPSDVTLFSCAQCSFKTKYKQCLVNHILKHQKLPEVTVYTCEICSYVTKRKWNLDVHVLKHRQTTTPSKVMLYSCQLCSFKTKYKHYLQKHVFTHRGRLPKVTVYICEICPYVTKFESNYQSHVLLHQSSQVTVQI